MREVRIRAGEGDVWNVGDPEQITSHSSPDEGVEDIAGPGEPCLGLPACNSSSREGGVAFVGSGIEAEEADHAVTAAREHEDECVVVYS